MSRRRGETRRMSEGCKWCKACCKRVLSRRKRGLYALTSIRSVHLLKKSKALHSSSGLSLAQLVKYVTLMYEDKLYKLTEDSFGFRTSLFSFTEERIWPLTMTSVVALLIMRLFCLGGAIMPPISTEERRLCSISVPPPR